MSAAKRLLRLPEVIERTGLSKGTIYLQRKAGKFPEPVLIGDRAVAWLSCEIQDWIEQQIKGRDSQIKNNSEKEVNK